VHQSRSSSTSSPGPGSIYAVSIGTELRDFQRWLSAADKTNGIVVLVIAVGVAYPAQACPQKENSFHGSFFLVPP
jgi:hypothetical protein